MNASGTSLLRASVPFLFVGWLVSLVVFAVNERVVPETSAIYERLRHEAFRGQESRQSLENVATMDQANRLYHARLFNLEQEELADLTILEHDAQNQPTQTWYVRRAIFTPQGWVLLHGTIYRMNPRGELVGEPEPFMERLIAFPVTPESFRQPETQPETMRYGQLNHLIARLKARGITNIRRFAVERASKVTLPLMNVVVCLISFVGSTSRQTRGHLRGLGMSLFWGVVYYVGVAIGHGVGKAGLLPAVLAVWLPHLIAVGCCVRELRRVT